MENGRAFSRRFYNTGTTLFFFQCWQHILKIYFMSLMTEILGHFIDVYIAPIRYRFNDLIFFLKRLASFERAPHCLNDANTKLSLCHHRISFYLLRNFNPCLAKSYNLVNGLFSLDISN